jgi:hypothetical protein
LPVANTEGQNGPGRHGQWRSTDPGSVRDFQAFARQTGNALLEQSEANREFVFYMRRK